MKLRIPITGLVSAGAALAALLVNANAFAQNIFVANWYAPGTIYEVTPGQAPTTYATVGGYIEGMAFNNSGNLFVSDNSGGSIDEFTTSGETTVQTGLNHPEGLAFNSAGDLLEADQGSGNVYEFTGTGRTTVASVPDAYGLAFNTSGDLYVSSVNNSIYEIAPGGLTTFVSSGLNQPNGIAFDAEGDLFEADEGSGNIYEFLNHGGTLSTTATLYASGLAEPEGLAIDSMGDLFVTQTSNGNGNLTEIKPGEAPIVLATGLGNDVSIAIQGESLPVPEPSTLALAAFGAAALFKLRRRKN